MQQDANWNVTAVVNSAGVQQRLVYTPFGVQTVLQANFTASGSSAMIVYGHQGGRYDSATGLYNFRWRDYSPTLERWDEQDPLGFDARDSNFYRVEGNNPTNTRDPLGLTALTADKIAADDIYMDEIVYWQIRAIHEANKETLGKGEKLSEGRQKRQQYVDALKKLIQLRDRKDGKVEVKAFYLKEDDILNPQLEFVPEARSKGADINLFIGHGFGDKKASENQLKNIKTLFEGVGVIRTTASLDLCVALGATITK